MQPDVRQECERTGVNAWLQPEPDKRVEVPVNEEDRHAHRPLLQGAVLGGEPRRTDARDGSGRRDPQILERVSTEKVATDGLDRHAQLR